jgi:hypothetical protein
MINVVKPLAVLGVAGAMALAAASPSEARSGRNAAAIGAGVAGFAIGAAAGAAAASSDRYYYGGPGYAYAPGYRYYDGGYAYAPRYYGGDPSSYYDPMYAYPRSYRQNGPAREDHLTGTGAGFID